MNKSRTGTQSESLRIRLGGTDEFRLTHALSKVGIVASWKSTHRTGGVLRPVP